MKQPLIVIAGPTATGKTKTAVELAKKINGEIISADSMQVYKYMDIGTAKPSLEEMQGIKHYLIDEIYPDEAYSVAIFQKKAKAYMQEILAKGKVPIIAGGTGFYINALVNDNDFTETENNNEYRNYLYMLAEKKGNEHIYHMLTEIDKNAAQKIHPNNVKRVVRALEYFKLTGDLISEHNENEKAKQSPYNTIFFVLDAERSLIYDKINKRVDEMVADGLVDEVKFLLDQSYDENLLSMQGLGYKEIVWHLKGQISLDESVDILKRDTRRFAKRQMTWFRGQCDGNYINLEDFDMNYTLIAENIQNYLEKYGIK